MPKQRKVDPVVAEILSHVQPTPMVSNDLSEDQKITIISEHFREIMKTLGLDLSDDSLEQTPKRVAKMYVQEIFNSIHLPSIYYLKNCAHLLPEMERCGADVLSVCETVCIGGNDILNRTRKGVQGNLYNGLLYSDEKTLRREVRKLLVAARKHHKKYIFNLNHGIFPDIPVGRVKAVIEEVKRFNWRE